MARPKQPRPGDTLISAIWLSGTETEDHFERWQAELPALVGSMWPQLKMTFAPSRHCIKYPGEELVPPVPDYIQGPNVRLLIAEVDVVSVEPVSEENSFIGQLEKKDLKRLRDLTRKSYTGPGVLADWQCDYIIEHMGPAAAARTIKDMVDRHITVH